MAPDHSRWTCAMSHHDLVVTFVYSAHTGSARALMHQHSPAPMRRFTVSDTGDNASRLTASFRLGCRTLESCLYLSLYPLSPPGCCHSVITRACTTCRARVDTSGFLWQAQWYWQLHPDPLGRLNGIGSNSDVAVVAVAPNST